MSDLGVYLMQNFASHLLAAVITLFILKYLLQYFNEACSANVISRGRPQLTGRRTAKKYDSLQRTKSNRTVKERSTLTLDRIRSKSKTFQNEKEKQAYILSQEGLLHPSIEGKTSATTANENPSEISESGTTEQYKSSLVMNAKMFQVERYNANQFDKDCPNKKLEKTSNDTKNGTTKMEKGFRTCAEDIHVIQMATNAEDTIDYNDSVSCPKSDIELTKSSGGGNLDESACEDDNVKKKNKRSNTVIFIDIHRKPCSRDPKRPIPPKPVMVPCPKPPQRRSYESVQGRELLRRSQPMQYQSDCFSEVGSGECPDDTTESCTDLQKGDSAELPYFLRSPSYISSRKCCEGYCRPKKCEPDPFRTVVIDFKPGYFLSCFSKCCRKLFANASQSGCTKDECPCNCSSCKFNSKTSRSESDQKLEPTKSNQKLEPTKSNQKLERTKSNQKLKRTKSNQKLEPTKSNQNLETTKSKQNLETTKSDQNLEPTKSNQKLQRNKSYTKPEPQSKKKHKSNEEISQVAISLTDDNALNILPDDERTVGYCNVGVNTNERVTSLNRRSLSRVFRTRPSASQQNPGNGVTQNDLLSSSSELSEESQHQRTFYQSQKKKKGKNPFGYLKRNLQTYTQCSNALPLFPKPSKKPRNYEPIEASLIGWRKEQTPSKEEIIDNTDVYDVSESSLWQNSSASSEMDLQSKTVLNRKEQKIRRSSFSTRKSNGSDGSNASSRGPKTATNPSNVCEQYNVDETTNSDCRLNDPEEKSSVDDEMAEALVKSFRSVLSEMAPTTITGDESTQSVGCRKKYKIRMSPRKKKRSSSSQRIPNKCKNNLLSASGNSVESNSKIKSENEDIDTTYSHSSFIKNIVINSSDYGEVKIGETDEEIKLSIEKNLVQLASLLPSFSGQSLPPEWDTERDCTCKRSLHSTKKISNKAKNQREPDFNSSSDENEVSKYQDEKIRTNQTRCKSAEAKTDLRIKSPKKYSNKSPQIVDSIKRGLTKLSALTYLDAHSSSSSHRNLTDDLLGNSSSEGNSSRDIECRSKFPKKCKSKFDLRTSRKTKLKQQSKSSPNIGTDDQNKTPKPSSKRESMNFCFSHLSLTDSDVENKETQFPEVSIEVDKIGSEIGLHANSESNESTKSFSEKKKIPEVDVTDIPPEISLGSLDTNDLSSYTILDFGFPSDSRSPAVALFPSDMNASWIILQRQGSTEERKSGTNIITKDAKSVNENKNGDPRWCPTKRVDKEINPKKYSDTRKSRRKNKMEEVAYISSDSEYSSEKIDFRTRKKSQPLLNNKTHKRRGGSSGIK